MMSGRALACGGREEPSSVAGGGSPDGGYERGAQPSGREPAAGPRQAGRRAGSVGLGAVVHFPLNECV